MWEMKQKIGNVEDWQGSPHSHFPPSSSWDIHGVETFGSRWGGLRGLSTLTKHPVPIPDPETQTLLWLKQTNQTGRNNKRIFNESDLALDANEGLWDNLAEALSLKSWIISQLKMFREHQSEFICFWGIFQCLINIKRVVVPGWELNLDVKASS